MLHTPYTTERKDVQAFIPEGCVRLLDVGCYSGAFGAALKRTRNIEIWGVEPDLEAARIAAERLDRVFAEPITDATALPDGYFDVITLNDSLEHIADPDRVLSILRSKLRPGGDALVICTLPNMRHIDSIEHLLLDKDWNYEPQGVRDVTHLRFFTKKSMANLFGKCGYELVDQIGINESWYRADNKLRRLLFRLLPHYTSDMRFIQYVNVLRVR